MIVLTSADPAWCIFASMMVHAHVHGVRHAAATAFDIFLNLRAVLLRLILKKQLHSLLLLIDLVSSFCIDVGHSSHFNAIILLICILKSVLVKVYRRWSETLRSRMVRRTHDRSRSGIARPTSRQLVRQAFPPTAYLLRRQ